MYPICIRRQINSNGKPASLVQREGDRLSGGGIDATNLILQAVNRSGYSSAAIYKIST